MGSPYSPDLYSTSLKRYVLCKNETKKAEQINQSRQIKKRSFKRQESRLKCSKTCHDALIKIISQFFVHIVTLNKICLLRNNFSPNKPTTLHLYIHSPLSPEDVRKLSSGFLHMSGFSLACHLKQGLGGACHLFSLHILSSCFPRHNLSFSLSDGFITARRRKGAFQCWP